MGVTRRQPQSSPAPRANGASSNSNSKDGGDKYSPHHPHHNPIPEAAADVPAPKYVTPTWVKATLVLFIAVTVLAWPGHLHPPLGEKPTVQYVFFFGWLTALSTGIGVLPFAFLPDVADYWVGISNGGY
jgi:hypothetical protein